MANAWSANKFTLDSGTDVSLAALTALKGSAPAHTDTIATWNGSRVWIQDGETLNFLKIYEGDNAGVAVTAGQRYAEIKVDGGGTLSFAGAANSANSCILANPASADASSKNCKLIIDMSNGKDVVFTNSIGANGTNNRWIINMPYGNIKTIRGWNSTQNRVCQWQCNYAYQYYINSIAMGTAKMNEGHTIDNVVGGILGTTIVALIASNDTSNIDLEHSFQNNTFDLTGITIGSNFMAIVYITPTAKLSAGGKIKYGGGKFIAPLTATTGGMSPIYCNAANGVPIYYGNNEISLTDIRATQVIPTAFTLIDMKDGLIKFTISNIARYADTDEINVFDSANVLRSCVTKARYIANGNYGLIPSLGVGTTLAGWYAKATSDNKIYSEASAVASMITTIATPRIDSLDKTVLPTSGGTLIGTGIGLTGATGFTLGGNAVTVVVNSDTQITITVPAITAGLKTLAGTTTAGAVSITNAVTVQAGSVAPGALSVTAISKARGNILLKWTPAVGFQTFDIYVNGSIPTGLSDLILCEKVITLQPDTTNTIYVKAKNSVGETNSNEITISTGKNASIIAGLTHNLVTELQQITIENGYTFTVNTVEQERMTERLNGRLPMLEVCGPGVTIETKTSRGMQYTAGYSVIYRALINDDKLTDDPATKQTENIAADIIMALMDDHTHGGLAIMTNVTDYYHTLDEASNGTAMFNVIVSIEILTHVDMFNPYKIG